MPLSAPTGLDLFGATPAEKEESRRDDRVRIRFDSVAGADGYEARVNGGVPMAAASGDWLLVTAPNSRQDIEVRATAQNEPPSPWSHPLSLVSRPPAPAAPVRRPYDLNGWGIVVDWDLSDTFPGSSVSLTTLWRQQDADPSTILLMSAPRTGSHVDSDYRRDAVKRYRLQTVVPRAHVPDDLLQGPNESVLGSELTAVHPYSIAAALTPARLEVLQAKREALLERLLDLGGRS